MRASAVEILHDPIDILSSKFEKKVDELNGGEAKASEMEHAIRHEIRVKIQENPVYYTSLKEVGETDRGTETTSDGHCGVSRAASWHD